MKHRRWAVLGGAWVLVIVTSVSVVLGLAVMWSHQALTALKQGHLESLRSPATRAQYIVNVSNALTLHSIASLRTWNHGLELLIVISQDMPLWQTYLQALADPGSLTPEAASKLRSDIKPSAQHLFSLSQDTLTDLQKSRLLKTILKQKWSHLDLAQLQHQLSQAATAWDILSTGQHNYILVFQNSHELRATGGFIGSYALISLDDGLISSFEIQDIYEPDGQFKGFIEAPHGVKEYLSSGNGLRLPDANWHPDFTSSSQTILSYFALGKQASLDGVIGFNLAAAQHILQVTGPIVLPDSNITVTDENLAEVARADRTDFFPGSQQKSQFLRSLFTNLRLHFVMLEPSQKTALITQLLTDLKQKNLLIYSNNQVLQELAESENLAGQIVAAPNTQLLGLIESNVGINKVNRFVKREVTLRPDDYRVGIDVTFYNEGPENYINYQRLIVPQDWILNTITLNGQETKEFHFDTLVTSHEDLYNQLGFLVPIPPNTTYTISIELTKPAWSPQTTGLSIFKQPGLPPTPYTIQFGTETQHLILDTDSVVSLPGTMLK